MQQQHIQACDSAKEMRDRLINIHEQRPATHKLLLIQRFHEYRMEPTDSVVVHISKVQNIPRQIVDLGENLPDIVIIAKILASLPSKYRSLWSRVVATRQTVEHLQERLLEEESYLENDEAEASALAATMGKHSRGDAKTYRNKSKI